jgi:hypothetical protein
MTLRAQPHLGGASPNYTDYIVDGLARKSPGFAV